MTPDPFLTHAIRITRTSFVAWVEARARQNGLFLCALELADGPLTSEAMSRARAAKLVADELERVARQDFAAAVSAFRRLREGYQ